MRSALRTLIRLALACAAAGLVAACGSAEPDDASSPPKDDPLTSATPTDGLPPLCDNLPLFMTAVDQLADGTMVEALEDLPEATAVSRAGNSAESVRVFGSLLGDKLPDGLEDDVALIMDTVASFAEHLQVGGEPADVDDFTGNEAFEQARENLRAFLNGDSGC